ncbi:MAG: type I polyketide synthase, partial [Deltaproteobacteria bacterium]|nr:type I polyketide synthase [Deltaproteobacteria bacterium]
MAIKSTDIAIVGMAGLFPKANDLDTLWSNMVNGVSAFAPAGKNRWRIDPDAMVSAAPCPDKAYSTSAALLNDVPFNFQGLNIDEELIRSLDPLYQVVLHTGRKAFHSCETTATDRARVGTILAAIALPTDGASRLADKIMGGSFESRLFPDPSKDPGDALIGRREALSGRVTALPAAILAKALGLGGGSFTLDAACASSLVALKLACDELTSLRKDAMLVGGVSRPDCLYTQVGFSQLQALSKSGICAPFDKKADGLVVGEGAGIFVLKRLDDALRDNDTIHALIKGIGLSNDMGGSLLSPASEGQVRALRSAYRLAGWRPSDVNYIECHGAGTPIGDLTEIKSLVDLWGDDGWNEGQCAIGSVKSMVGHMLTAAGAAGVIKTLLGMHNRTIPPTLNFEAPPPNNPLPESPFRVPAAPERWEPVRTGAPLRAGVNAFGFGGINAHLLLEEYRSDPPGSGKSPADSGNHTTPSAKKESAAFVRVSGNRNQAPIAIVGMDACFGGLNSLRAFQEAVFNGSAALCERPPKRWRGTEKVVRLQLGTNDLPGAYMDAFDWDPGMFNIPPHDIPDIIPQHLLALKTAAGAMRDAGLPLREKRENAGVVIGTGFDFEATDFHLRWMLTEKIRTWNSAHRLNLSAADMRAWLDRLQNALGPPLTSNRTQGALTGIIASRVAKAFLFGGPSLVVSAEEASGWIAIDLAVKALRQNELDTVLVGAVDMAGDVRQLLLNDVDTYSRQHIVRPFDRQADGTLPGEGAAAVVLQRLDRARRDGRRVYAVIRGTGCATGGGIDTAMEPGVYIRSLERCFDDAGAAPESIQMMETHGSGIIAEDSLEAEALNIYFADRLHNCAVGSAKAVVGHTGAASSLASVVKTALCIYHRLTPPLTNFTQPAKNIWNTDAFHLPQQPHPWLGNRVEGPVQACVAAMTGDGLCAHLLMASDEEDRKPLARTSDRAAVERLRPLGVRDFGLFTVEADTPHELLSGLDDLRRHIRKHTAADARLEKAAYRWYRQKGLDRRKKLAVSVLMRPSDDRERLLDIARHQIASGNGETAGRHTRVSYAARPLGTAGKLAVVFPGSGNHYLGMGCDVAVQWPEIIRQMDNDTDRLQSQFAPWAFVPFRTSWHAGWQKEALQQVLSDPLHTIFGQVMHGSVMFDLVKRFGIDPEAIIGYSLGESAGLFASRAWKDRERMLSRMLRSPLFKHELSGPCSSLRQAWQIPAGERFTWKVAVVNVPADKAAEIVKSHPHTRLLIVNTPAECVIGGDADQLAEVIDTLACDAVFLDGVVTVHCDAALPVAEQYRALHALPTSAPPGVSYYSCAWAQAYALSREKAADSILA